jgi:hypothetical protein
MWTHKAKKIVISINGDGSKIVIRTAATAIAAAAQTCQEMNLNIVPLFSVGHPERLKDYHDLVARELPSFNCGKSRRTPSGDAGEIEAAR